MKAKSKLPAWPSASSASSVSSAGRRRRSILSCTPASAQVRRARAVYSSLTSQAMILPSGGSASATQDEL